jgi:hypothetical protein
VYMSNETLKEFIHQLGTVQAPEAYAGIACAVSISPSS